MPTGPLGGHQHPGPLRQTGPQWNHQGKCTDMEPCHQTVPDRLSNRGREDTYSETVSCAEVKEVNGGDRATTLQPSQAAQRRLSGSRTAWSPPPTSRDRPFRPCVFQPSLLVPTLTSGTILRKRQLVLRCQKLFASIGLFSLQS